MQSTIDRCRKPAGSGKAVNADCSVKRSAGRERQLAGQLIDRKNAVEAEQLYQRAAIIGIKPAGQHARRPLPNAPGRPLRRR